jgi:hypothetical protein
MSGHDARAATTGVAVGLVTDRESEEIVATLRAGDVPGGPDAPWLAVVIRGDGSVAAAAAMMLGSGFFWAYDGHGRLVIAGDPRGAARAAGNARISADSVRKWLCGDIDQADTLYEGVRRVPPGVTAVWRADHSRSGAAPALRPWCGPDVWGPPTLSGPRAADIYLQAFRAVTADLSRRGGVAGTTVAAVSGGLDSSFLAACLAGASGGRLLAGVHTPHPMATLPRLPGMILDESPLVAQLAARYPQRIEVVGLANLEGQTALQAAAATAARTGMPAFNPANEIWLTKLRAITRELGAPGLFVGANGNLAFSGDHPYAFSYHLAKGQLLAAATVRPLLGDPLRQRLRRLTSHPTGTLLAHRRAVAPTSRPSILPGVPGQVLRSARGSREGFLEALGGPGGARAAATHPGDGIYLLDPYRSRTILDLAAAITPATWQQGPLPRGFAREIMCGLVPDAIRCNTAFGVQSGDTWHPISHLKDEYLDRITAVADVPGLEQVNTTRLLDHVQTWPWGQADGPHPTQLFSLDRLLALAEFATRAWATNATPAP